MALILHKMVPCNKNIFSEARVMLSNDKFHASCHGIPWHTDNLYEEHEHDPRTTVSQDVQTRFPVQLAFAKFLSKIKGNFWGSAVSMILALYWKFPFILDRNLAKANCTGNHVCTSCDTVVLGKTLKCTLRSVAMNSVVCCDKWMVWQFSVSKACEGA